MKPNFSEMSIPELRTYVRSHRDDIEAIRALFLHPSLIDKYQTMPPMLNPNGTPNEENIRFGEEALRRRIERDKDQETQ